MDHKVTTDYTRLLGNANVKVSIEQYDLLSLPIYHSSRYMFAHDRVQMVKLLQRICSNEVKKTHEIS